MDYIVSGHKYVDDVVSMLMMFYPNENIRRLMKWEIILQLFLYCLKHSISSCF